MIKQSSSTYESKSKNPSKSPIRKPREYTT